MSWINSNNHEADDHNADLILKAAYIHTYIYIYTHTRLVLIFNQKTSPVLSNYPIFC